MVYILSAAVALATILVILLSVIGCKMKRRSPHTGNLKTLCSFYYHHYFLDCFWLFDFCFVSRIRKSINQCNIFNTNDIIWRGEDCLAELVCNKCFSTATVILIIYFFLVFSHFKEQKPLIMLRSSISRRADQKKKEETTPALNVCTLASSCKLSFSIPNIKLFFYVDISIV